MNTQTENMLPGTLMEHPHNQFGETTEKEPSQVVDLATLLLTIGGLSPGQIAKFKARKMEGELNARIAGEAEARRKFIEG